MTPQPGARIVSFLHRHINPERKKHLRPTPPRLLPSAGAACPAPASSPPPPSPALRRRLPCARLLPALPPATPAPPLPRRLANNRPHTLCPPSCAGGARPASALPPAPDSSPAPALPTAPVLAAAGADVLGFFPLYVEESPASLPPAQQDAVALPEEMDDLLLTTNKDKMLRRRYSVNLPEHLPEHHMITSAQQSERTIPKSVADLVWEIAALEEEVVRKELHLLSIYRAAFDQHLGVSPRVSAQVDQEIHHQKGRKKADEAGLMEQIKLDRYLQPHFRYYMREVRTVVYSQFLESYKNVTMEAMASAFGVTVDFI
ncbi:hypothetical protein E2562_017533 [Oryza meyeriana var. granulata]|uniref:PCI domain-containing protein n=1 Tax=Oryza meyeriana var. granulata TaxID=110450 RepID=A0A6G1C7D0_9ORYZ|nr:hypothetical protein E2562_017533 [Oryza meyeriana var. granulata]